MWIVRLALRRPYTFVVASILIVILGVVCHPADADGYFSEHRHPGGQRDMELHGAARRRTWPNRIVYGFERDPDHDRQQYRAHRVAIVDGNRDREGLFQPGANVAAAMAQISGRRTVGAAGNRLPARPRPI